MTSEPPALFAGRYRLEAPIGRGAASVVYRARDEVAGHAVALKLLDPRLSWDPNALERLRREVIVSRRIQHPGVVRVHDLVTDGDRAAVIQELVDGIALADLVAREGPLPVKRAIDLAKGVLEALAACHQKGVLHRDLRPANVLVEAGDRVRLVDFGIARVAQMTTVTHTGAILGTPGYQAPEVLRGERPDLRADLYGVGLLLFEMLAGHPAFADAEGAALFRQLSERPPDLGEVRRDIPPRLATLVGELLDRHPEMRPAGAYDVLEVLEDLGSDPPTHAPGPECPDCRHKNRGPIPFCAACGRYKRIALRPGDSFVRVHGLEQALAYGQRLDDLFGAAADPALLLAHHRGGNPSFVLVRGLDRESAAAFVADIGRFGGAGEVGLGWGFLQLGEGVSGRSVGLAFAGGALVLLGVLGMAISNFRDHTFVGLGLLSLLLGLAFLAAVALVAARSLRPVIDVARVLGTARPSRTAQAAQKLAAQVTGLRAGPLAEPLAMAVEAYWDARLAVPDTAGAYAKALDALLEKVFLVVRRATPVVRLLAGRSSADAARDLERVGARQRAAGGSAPEIVRMGEALAEEVRALEEADDLLSSAAGRLVLAAGLLHRQARALAKASRPALEERALQEFLEQTDVELLALERVLAAAQSPPSEDPGSRPRQEAS